MLKSLESKFTSKNSIPVDRAIILRSEYEELKAKFDKLQKAYWLVRNSAAGLTNYCEDSASVRRCEKELQEAEAIYRTL